GRLQQCDTPRALYERPVNTFVAAFIGSPAMNLCTVALDSSGCVPFGSEKVAVPQELAAAVQANGSPDVVLGLRPESLVVGAEGMPAQVEVVEELGADAYVFCVADVAGETTKLVARTEARLAPDRGDRVALLPRAG